MFGADQWAVPAWILQSSAGEDMHVPINDQMNVILTNLFGPGNWIWGQIFVNLCYKLIQMLMDPSMLCVVQEGVLFDAGMLTWVLKRTCPSAHKHLQHHGVEPLMFATDWLMCLFTRHLPFNTLLRVWDLFFCYGKADRSHVLYGFPKGKAIKLMYVNVIFVLYWSSK